MILMQDGIYKQNVISKKDMFYLKDMKVHLEAFIKQVKELNVTTNGKVFYMISEVPSNEIMKVEFFISVKEEVKEVPKGFRFHSYFGIDSMMSVRVKMNKSQGVMMAYNEILETVNSRGIKRTTGFFHILNEVKGENYITIKVGYK